MKSKFLIIKKMHIAVLFGVSLFLGTAFGTYFAVAKTSATPRPLHTIVIDAGHGGKDVKLEQYKIFVI